MVIVHLTCHSNRHGYPLDPIQPFANNQNNIILNSKRLDDSYSQLQLSTKVIILIRMELTSFIHIYLLQITNNYLQIPFSKSANLISLRFFRQVRPTVSL